MNTSRYTDSQIIAILKQAEAGSPIRNRPTPPSMNTP